MAGSSAETAEARTLSQPGVIIGAFPEMNYQSEALDLPEFSRLYVFSDGIYEVTRPDDSMMTYQEFAEILAGSGRAGGSAIERTMGDIRTVRGGDQFEDDVSIIEVTL
jgi:sigma-B regulation protein RsbU (phosphoserine phosphatase)